MPTSARWEVTNSPKISVKSTYSAGGQSRPPLQGELRLVVGADDSVGPLGSCEFAEQFCKKQVQTAGSMCTGKRQTHIRNAPSSRTAVTGIGPCSVHANQQLPIICGDPIPIKVYHTFFLHTSSRKTGIRAGFR